MSEKTYFLTDENIQFFYQYGFSSSDFEEPTLLPKVGNKKARSLWNGPNADTVTKMLNLIDIESHKLGPLIGMSAKSTYIYSKGDSKFQIKYCCWQLLCNVALKKLKGDKIPEPDSFIFVEDEKAVLLRFFGEETMRYPKKADNNHDGSSVWDATPEIKQVAFALDYLAENGYKVPQMITVWGLDDRAVRRKKKELSIDLAQFIIMCQLILKVEKASRSK